jgi:signal transduction histidine kinase/ActR/RegA family two-component response regulator
MEAMPNLEHFIATGQMEIISINDWYKPGDKLDADAILQGWLGKEAESKARGFNGLRISGDTFWLERSGWDDFMEYENKVNGAFAEYNLLALCTYHLDKCSADDVIDVCCQHQFALARRKGTWELLESPSTKIAKDHLHRTNSELESRVEARTRELNTALKARDEFLAMLGHELRNPLAPIRNATEIIRALTPPNSPLSSSTAILDRQVHHITRLVDDLLDVGRITQGQIQLQFKPISLADAIEQAVEITRPFIDTRHQLLTVTLPARSIKVHADAIRLSQVFGNLLHNAAKYTPDGGQIAIQARVHGDIVTVDVSDSGAGIPADMLTSIFVLFIQLPRSLARSDGGLGIGLTLVQRIVQMHGGSVTAKSGGVGLGSQFEVQLPVHIDQSEKADSCAAAVIPEKAYDGIKVLIVDDNLDSNTSLSALFSISGYDVRCAADGNTGLELARSFRPAVILLDIGLPGFDGYEVARRLRLDSRTSHIRLIAVTGYGQDKDIARAKEVGFDAHILKPAKFEDLLSSIKPTTKTFDANMH